MRLGLLLSLFLIGCAGSHERCGDKFLIPWPNSEGRYVLQEIQLNTLSNPYQLKGDAAEVYHGNVLTDGGFDGSVAEPHFTRAGDVCVPSDTASSAVVSAYAQMEKLYDFEGVLGTREQIKWPRKVGVEIRVNGKPIDVVNNAHYYGDQDAMALVPYERGDLPLSFNVGVVAHEHFHAHFQSVVYGAFNTALKMVVSVEKLFLPDMLDFRGRAEDIQGSDLSTPRGVNNYLLRGWNEGLADFFAGVYTKRTDFFAVSLPEYGPKRRLDLPLGRITSAQINDVYGQGAFLARALFAIAHSADRPPEAVLKHVLERIGEIPRQLVSTYTQAPFAGDAILPILLRDLPLNKAMCDQLGAVMSVKSFPRGFPTCAR